MKIGMILFENLTQLDLTGPYEVFNRLPNTQIYLIAETITAVKSDGGMKIMSDTTFHDCPLLDILFVPGGPGVSAAMENDVLMAFLKKQSLTAQYITSVCTGSLVLGMAGLLRGYKATTHWLSLDLLTLFEDVTVEKQRVVIDKNRITGGGVTAGIDFGLTLVASIFNENLAKEIQLILEYNPQPPFNAGSPDTADVELLEYVKTKREGIQSERKKHILKLLNAK
jgi:cyclohexyl-isocyanide hydratase